MGLHRDLPIDAQNALDISLTGILRSVFANRSLDQSTTHSLLRDSAIAQYKKQYDHQTSMETPVRTPYMREGASS